MPKLLLSLFISLVHTLMFARDSNWLSKEAGQQLALIYHSSPINIKGEGFEPDYLVAYNYFFSYLAFEQSHDAEAFYTRYDLFEAQESETTVFQLMRVNLGIQKSLLLFMQGQTLEGAQAFYKAHRYFLRLDSAVCGAEYIKLQALFDIFLAQIPGQHQFFASFWGLKGNISRGFTLLNRYLQTVTDRQGLYHEALVLYGYCLLKFGQPTGKELYDYFALTVQYNSPIMVFINTSLAIKNRLGDKAVELSCMYSDKYNQKFPLIFYIKGRALLNKMDAEAIKTFDAFYKNYNGHSFKADALMRQAWWYHIKGEQAQRNDKIEQCRTQSVWPTSNDKQAKAEILNLADEPLELLNARLFFDGGYYKQAQHVLSRIDKALLPGYYLADYYYRYARVCQALNKTSEAFLNYKQVVSLCGDDKRYIGPYSALELAKICLARGAGVKASQYLDMAKTLNTGQYKNDISNKIAQLEKELEL